MQVICVCATVVLGAIGVVLSGSLLGPRLGKFLVRTCARKCRTARPSGPSQTADAFLPDVSAEQQNPTDLYSSPRLRPPTLTESPTSPIPRIAWQTARSHDGATDDMWRLVQAFRRSAPTMDHFFLDDREADALIAAHFNSSVHEAYKRLPLGVMRSDVIRVVVVYLYGGAYADTDTTLLEPTSAWLRDGCDVVLGVEDNRKLVTQFAFAATPKHPLVASVMEGIIKNIMSQYDKHGRHFVHETTGPLAMTMGALRYLETVGWAPPRGAAGDDGTPADDEKDTPAFSAGQPDLDTFATDHGAALKKSTGVCINSASRTEALMKNGAASVTVQLQSSAWPSWRVERDQLREAGQPPV